jgi:hypothetical protein
MKFVRSENMADYAWGQLQFSEEEQKFLPMLQQLTKEYFMVFTNQLELVAVVGLMPGSMVSNKAKVWIAFTGAKIGRKLLADSKRMLDRQQLWPNYLWLEADIAHSNPEHIRFAIFFGFTPLEIQETYTIYRRKN